MCSNFVNRHRKPWLRHGWSTANDATCFWVFRFLGLLSEYQLIPQKHEAVSLFKNYLQSKLHIIANLQPNHPEATFRVYAQHISGAGFPTGKRQMQLREFGLPPTPPELGDVHIPDSLDWRYATKNHLGINAVNAVRNQGSCGTCWAHSAIAALEGNLAVKTGKLHKFSEMKLAGGMQGCACRSKPVADWGNSKCPFCRGGSQCDGIAWMANNGYCLETPYCGNDQNQTCGDVCQRDLNCNTQPNALNASNPYTCARNADDVVKYLVTHGPLTVRVDYGFFSPLPNYKSGIVDIDGMGPGGSHYMNLVGYGTDATSGTPYWIVRNSFGTGWGEHG